MGTKSLKELYKEEYAKLKEKYKDAVNEIAEKYKVPAGDAFDMLRASARGGEYADGIEIDKEQLKKDCDELLSLAEQVCKEEGLLN